MPDAKTNSVQFDIKGQVDSSFASAMGMTLDEFKKVNQEIHSVTSSINEIQAAITAVAGVTGFGMLFDTIKDGAEGAVGAIEGVIGKLAEMGQEASKQAAQFEVVSKGMGALFKDQAFADSLLNDLRLTANASPFEPNTLYSVARGLAGRGMNKNQIEGATDMLGDIGAGLGGSPEILDRLSLAYGEAFDEKTVNKRILNQFSQAGVPLMQQLMEDMGMNPENTKDVQAFLKEVHDKKLGFDDVNKALKALTSGTGLFADGMKKFAETFTGLQTTFAGDLRKVITETGDIYNEFADTVLKFVDNSPVWDEINGWLADVNAMAAEVNTFVQNSGVLDQFGPVIENYMGMLNPVSTWMKSFFTEFYGPDGSIQYALKTGPMADAEAAIKTIATVFNDIAAFLKQLGALTIDEANIKGIMEEFGFLMKLMGDVASMNPSAVAGDMASQAMYLHNRMANPGDQAKQDKAVGDANKAAWDAVSNWNIPAFADGGIVSAAQLALIGEKGPEAVVPLDSFRDFAEYMKSLGESVAQLAENINGATGGFMGGGGASGYGAGGGADWVGGGTPGSAGSVRVEGYGPAYGEYGQVTGNHGNALRGGDYAISGNLVRGHRPGDTFTFTDGAGNVHHGRYEDSSFISPGRPNTNVIEGWNQKDLGRTKDFKWDGPPLTVNIQAIDAASFNEKIHEHAKVIHKAIMDVHEMHNGGDMLS